MEENVNTLKEATQFASVAEKPSEKQEQTTESHTHENEHDHSHNHSHAHDKATERIYEGYFEDNQVKDRPLSDWTGDWQSVYPYLQDGTLDEVFAYKAKHKGKMSAKEYKEYYNEGYQTDVNRIVIQGDTVTFYKNKEEYSGKYIYDGYKILTYDAGNRGVRYIFKLAEKQKEFLSIFNLVIMVFIRIKLITTTCIGVTIVKLYWMKSYTGLPTTHRIRMDMILRTR